MPVFDPLIFDPLVFDAGPAPSSDGLFIYRNGVFAALTFNDEQLGSISLAMAAYDAEIGMGQITVPGDPGWVAGDRISIRDGANLIYTGYVMDHARSRGAEPLAVQTTYQLMDVNRQLIGRKVVDYTQGEVTAYARLLGFFTDIAPDLSLDTTSWVFPDTTDMPERTYTGDGLMDIAADLIKYTGNTIFLALTPTENRFALHFHALTTGTQAGLQIADDTVSGGALPVTYGGEQVVFGGVPVVFTSASALPTYRPQHPLASFSASDLKNDIEVRNGVTTVAGSNALSLVRHGAGGLKFQAVLDYSGIDEQSLILVADSILTQTGIDERPSYSCTLGPLTGAEVLLIPAGSIVWTQVAVFGDAMPLRIAHITLTVTRDQQGRPVPGLWDAALELGNPLRQPAATTNLGGQFGDSGRLSDPLVWDSTRVTEDDPGIPVGSTETVTAQLLDGDREMPIPDVTLTWSIEQFDASDNPTSDYSLSDTTSVTDISGLALITVSHDADTGTVRHRVLAGP